MHTIYTQYIYAQQLYGRENSRMIFFHVFESDQRAHRCAGADVHGTMLPLTSTFMSSWKHCYQREYAKAYICYYKNMLYVVRSACNASPNPSTSVANRACLSIYAVFNRYIFFIFVDAFGLRLKYTFSCSFSHRFVWKAHVSKNHRRACCTHFSISITLWNIMYFSYHFVHAQVCGKVCSLN